MTYYDYHDYYSGIEQLREIWQYLVPIMVFLLILCIISLVEYFIRAYSIHSISKKQGVANGWLGYIPIARDYQLGAIAGDLELGKRSIKNTGLWLIITPIIAWGIMYGASFAFSIPMNLAILTIDSPEGLIGFLSVLYIYLIVYCFVAAILQAAISTLRGAALHKLFSKYSEKQMPVVFALISIMLPLGETICLFIHRKKPLLEQTLANNYQPALAVASTQEADIAATDKPEEDNSSD